MENKRKSRIVTRTLVAGALITGSAFTMNISNAFSFNELGSGNDVRSQLMNDVSKTIMTTDQNCGEKTKEGKTKEAKCGEGKCGEESKKQESKSEKKEKTESKTESKKESKSKEAKCGEGKCGN